MCPEKQWGLFYYLSLGNMVSWVVINLEQERADETTAPNSSLHEKKGQEKCKTAPPETQTRTRMRKWEQWLMVKSRAISYRWQNGGSNPPVKMSPPPTHTYTHSLPSSCSSCRIHVREEEEAGSRKRAPGSGQMSNERRCMAVQLHPAGQNPGSAAIWLRKREKGVTKTVLTLCVHQIYE